MDDLKFYSCNEKELESSVQTIHVFSKDIGMEYGIKNCAMLMIEKGKIVKSVGIELPDDKVIKSLQELKSFKYLGISEVDIFQGEEMKLKVSKEYFTRFKKVLKSKLNDWNLVQGVNLGIVSFKIFSSIY